MIRLLHWLLISTRPSRPIDQARSSASFFFQAPTRLWGVGNFRAGPSGTRRGDGEGELREGMRPMEAGSGQKFVRADAKG